MKFMRWQNKRKTRDINTQRTHTNIHNIIARTHSASHPIHFNFQPLKNRRAQKFKPIEWLNGMQMETFRDKEQTNRTGIQ